MIAVARYALAAIALWLALRGSWRLWRAGMCVTAGSVLTAVAAGAALGLSLWLATASPREVTDTAGELLQWLAQRSGLASALDWAVQWVTQRLADAVDAVVDAVLEALGIR